MLHTHTVALRLLFGPYAAPLQHHGPLPPLMGDWAAWADWVDPITDTSAFEFLFQSFSACWKMGKSFFHSVATSVAQRSTFLFSDVTDWLRLWKWKSTFFVPHWPRTNENKVLSHFSTCWRSSNGEVKCVIAFTQSAHVNHSAQSPIYGGNGLMVLQWRHIGARK